MVARIGVVIFCLCVLPNLAQAGAVSEPFFGINSANAVPFGSIVLTFPPQPQCCFQERYFENVPSNLFPGPVSITGLDFVPAPDAYTQSTVFAGSITIKLGYGDPIGGNPLINNFQPLPSAVVYSNPTFAENIVFNSYSLNFPFLDAPFAYDPSLGDLLFEIDVLAVPGKTIAAETSNISTFASYIDTTNSVVGHPSFGPAEPDGLAVQVDYQNVPEPPSLLLALTGVVALCAVHRTLRPAPDRIRR